MSAGSLKEIEALIEKLSPVEARRLMDVLVKKTRAKTSRRKASCATLAEYFKEKLPDNVDLDAELVKLRNEWKKELLGEMVE